MEITEVRIKLMEEDSERLKAFCSITFDNCFVVRDLKIIEGSSGPFVAMPSRKLTAHCPQCGYKNHLRAGYCNQCGGRLKEDRASRDDDGRAKLYADIAHPINSECREMIQDRVVQEYQQELERAKEPGYLSRYDDIEFETPAPHISLRPHAPANTNEGAEGDEPRERSPRHEAHEKQPPHHGSQHSPDRRHDSQPRSHARTPRKESGFGEGIF